MKATPEEYFNLTIKAFDDCRNPTNLPANFQFGAIWNITANFPFGQMIQRPDAQKKFSYHSVSNAYTVSTTGQAEVTIDKLYYVNAWDRLVTFGSVYEFFANNYGGIVSPYHDVRSTINSVYGYSLRDFSVQNVAAGKKITFRLVAGTLGGAAVKGVDSLLRAQTYTWFGGSKSPSGDFPDYPPTVGGATGVGLDFTDGVTSPISVTFKKAEYIKDFYVMDNFVPGPSGVGGSGLNGRRRSEGWNIYNTPELPIEVGHGLPSQLVLTSDSTSQKAGVGFDVTVTAFDKYKNLVTGFGSDTLTYAWTGASSSVANSINSTAKSAEVLTPGLRTFDNNTASFTTTGAPFVLYRSNATVLAPQETPTLTVTGAKTGSQTETGQPLTASLSFSVQPNDTIAYTRISTESVYSAATDFHNQNLTIPTDQTKSFFAHLFDPWGNYKGTSANTAWTGTGSVAGRLAPTPSVTTTLTPTITGPGVITASCDAVATGCLPASTGTINVNPSPLVSFGVEQISHPEGANLTAGDQMQLKVCMLDKNGQKITSLVQNGTTTVTDPDATLSINVSFINISLNSENNTLALSTDKDANFVTKAFGEGSNQLKFTQGCFDLYAKVLKSGTYGVTAPLLQLSHVDTLQNNISVGGAGIKVGAVAAGLLDHYVTFPRLTNAPTFMHVPAWATPGTANLHVTSGGNRFSVDVSALDLY
jgi:hypothetical protein